ncbi:MAG: hypothetical protein A3I09_03330 [Deltaproteobacteria bacterium RIFCSPLOWO2_02_FULL_47_10]|nr:MAG: hypothetical protein A3I09_03330 [Deltaproteobacteria bacterium RIFCSPLOWO2_02_FULL_47_10]
MRRHFIDIIYEDRDIIAVNKPRGVEVANAQASALVDNVRAYLIRKFPGAAGSFVKPLHRLDKETTGIVLLAKSGAGMGLVEDIKEHRVRRTYSAVVEGAVEDEDGTIKLPLEKRDFGHGKKVGVAERGGGKKTITHYHVVERYENASLLDINLETGFTHQIRVHLAAIGHPLAGDKIYNPHGTIKFPRQALHAAGVIFRHPVTGGKIQLKSPLPSDMEELVDRLRGN